MKLSGIYSFALDWFFPPRCGGCGKLGSHWCDDCDKRTYRLLDPVCEKCGYPLAASDENCPVCTIHSFNFTQALSWGKYANELRQAILKLKHKRNESLGEALAKKLFPFPTFQEWKVDLVVPIPLAYERQSGRGFNQAELIARPLAGHLNLPMLPHALRRERETRPQADLTVEQRWSNLASAFGGNPQQFEGLSVLIVDDIMTTGATLDSGARAARAAGAKDVYALTLARTLLS